MKTIQSRCISTGDKDGTPIIAFYESPKQIAEIIVVPDAKSALGLRNAVNELVALYYPEIKDTPFPPIPKIGGQPHFNGNTGAKL